MSERDRLYLFCAVTYFAQGMLGIVYEPVAYFLKDGLGLGAGQSAVFVAWMTAPFLVKPLFGLLTDLFPIAGRLRGPHLALAAAAGAAAWLTLAGLPRHAYGPLLALLVVTNLSLVFCDVVCDGVMVERGKELGKTGTYQAVQIGTLYATLVLTGVGGGWLTAHVPLRWIFGMASVFSLLTLGSSVWVVERSGAARGARGLGPLKALLAGRRFWAVSLLIFLWNFAPFLGTAQFYYQSEALGLGPVFIGFLSTLGGAAGVAGAVFYGRVVGRRWSTGTLVRAAVLLGGPMSLLYLFYRGPGSAAALTVLFGATGVAFRLALMDLAAQSCPEGAEATAFAAYMAVFNLAALVSNTAGGTLYETLKRAAAGFADPAYAASAVLILVGAAATLSCWGLLPLVKDGPLPRTAGGVVDNT